MKVHTFAAAVAAAAVALVFTQPAGAQEKRVRLNMGMAFPSANAILGPGQVALTEKVRKMSNGSIDMRHFEPGALVPASQYFDAVSNGSLDSAWSGLGFFTGKDIAFALFSSVPFGPEMGEYLAWMRVGGGEQLMQELARKYNVEPILCGTIAPEASGWFRKEIKSVDDLKGLKMRFFGLGAVVMQKLGVSTQILQAGEIFQALQLGTIDATEFSMPVMDLSLGFHQVAKHYYFPGWHQMATFLHLLVSKKKWDELSDSQKEIIKTACDSTMLQNYLEGEGLQSNAIKEIQSKGVTIHYWPKDILDTYRRTWEEVVKEQQAKSPEFAKVWASLSKFREEYKVWRDHGYLKQ
ncbi:MAG: TRAP transporter substrate-binding protein [Xanthobacteraceae bacterium]|jgi:TRAP-type mannitol/chloroaromatic compound transport system substrate-binding protein